MFGSCKLAEPMLQNILKSYKFLLLLYIYGDYQKQIEIHTISVIMSCINYCDGLSSRIFSVSWVYVFHISTEEEWIIILKDNCKVHITT